MPGYTKLFSTIVSSTIWREDANTKVVWVTLLALADKNGEIQASVPGLAHIAGVPLEATESALQKFQAPDPYSRSKVSEGRRIAAISGGWELINHAKYREMEDLEDKKSQHALRQKRYRERKSRDANSDARASLVTESDDIAEAEAEAIHNLPCSTGVERAGATTVSTARKPRAAEEPPSQAETVYAAYPRKQGKQTALKFIKAAIKKHGFETVLEATQAYATAASRWPESDKRFIPWPERWFKKACFLDDRSNWERRFDDKGKRVMPRAPAGPSQDDLRVMHEISERNKANAERDRLQRERDDALRILSQPNGNATRDEMVSQPKVPNMQNLQNLVFKPKQVPKIG